MNGIAYRYKTVKNRAPSKSNGLEKDPSPALLRRAPSPHGRGKGINITALSEGRGCPTEEGG